MRLRIRFSNKQETIEIPDDLILVELCSLINEKAGDIDISGDMSIKFGFPPRKLLITDNEIEPVIGLGIKNGEVLIVDYAATEEKVVETKEELKNPENIPYIDTETGHLLIHKIPDDNSCLFHSIIYSAELENMFTVHDLRTVVSSLVLENKDGIYNEAILGKSLKSYSEWILNPQAWGGEIELNILSKFLNVEIVTIDIESTHTYKFNTSLKNFIMLLYSGVHYDSIIFQKSKDLTSDVGKISKFTRGDLLAFEIIENHIALINLLNMMGYFTNTSKFKLRCGDCQRLLVGEKDATEHASETGHFNFQEY